MTRITEEIEKTIDRIFDRGNDVMLRRRRTKSGNLETIVYEIKPSIVNREVVFSEVNGNALEMEKENH